MIRSMPKSDSRRAQKAARNRSTIVTGIAAAVKPNSTCSVDVFLGTTTRNCTVNARKKKKSNLRRAI